jgi:hypothetical protein
VTRVIAFLSGLRYLTGPTVSFWQFLDLDLLRHHLLRGLLHLHGQPPLFNALVGLSEKIGGSHYGQLILGLQLLLGLAAVISVYLLLTQLQVASAFSFVISCVLLFNPAEIAFEFDPLYTEIVSALNCFIALAIVCYLRGRSSRALYWLIGIAVCLTLVRSSYQWIWLGAMLAVLWWQLPESRRQIRNAGVAGVLLTLVWPAKNYVLFRHFTSSTWAPFSIAKHWQAERLGPPIDTWLHEGLLPTFALPSAASEEQFQAWLQTRWLMPPNGAPELDDIAKATGRATNWNSLAMLRMHDAQAEDVWFLLRHDPKAYSVNVARGLKLYFEPATVWLTLFPDELMQYQHMARADRIVRHICCNIFGIPPGIAIGANHDTAATGHSSIKVLIQSICMGAVLMNGFVLLFVLSLGRRSLWGGNRDRKVAAMVMTITIMYGFLVTTLLEIGENMRFRFETQALVLVVAAILLQQLWDRRTRES